MYAALKQMTDFRTYRPLSVSAYDVALASRASYKSSVTVRVGEASQLDGGAWLILNGRLWVVDTVNPGELKTVIRCKDALAAFDREIVYTAPADGQTVGGFIAETLEREFKAQSDSFFALPYLDITSTDTTAFVAPEVDDDSVFGFLDYLMMADEKYSVRTSLAISGNTLRVQIEHRQPEQRQVVFNDGHAELVKQAYSMNSVSKITTHQDGTITDWYLSAAGEISTEPPALRAPGGWKRLSVSSGTDADEKVRETFNKNAGSHIIEFWSDRAYELGDPVRFRINDGVFEGSISFVGLKSGDKRTYYKSGELKTTLVEHLRGVIS